MHWKKFCASRDLNQLKKCLVWTLSPQYYMLLLLFISVMLSRKAGYPNPGLIQLIQALILQRWTATANNGWSKKVPRQGDPTAHWDCRSRDITQIEIDTPYTLATRLWEYQDYLVNFCIYLSLIWKIRPPASISGT
jgi:hypothetical protein